MPHAFLQVGAHWINLDQVAGIEIIPAPDDPARILCAKVNYTSGHFHEFKAAPDIETLRNWLRAHKAP